MRKGAIGGDVVLLLSPCHLRALANVGGDMGGVANPYDVFVVIPDILLVVVLKGTL